MHDQLVLSFRLWNTFLVISVSLFHGFGWIWMDFQWMSGYMDKWILDIRMYGYMDIRMYIHDRRVQTGGRGFEGFDGFDGFEGFDGFDGFEGFSGFDGQFEG